MSSPIASLVAGFGSATEHGELYPILLLCTANIPAVPGHHAPVPHLPVLGTAHGLHLHHGGHA